MLDSKLISSCLKVSVSAVTAYLEAGYTFFKGNVGTKCPAILFILTMRPLSTLLFNIRFIASLQAIVKPITLVSNTILKSEVVPLMIFVGLAIPALLTSREIGPTFVSAQTKAYLISASLVMSVLSGNSLPDSDFSSWARASSRAIRLAKPTTYTFFY